MSFIEVVFNLPIHHAFTYKLPPDIPHVLPGMRVFAPFGNRTLTGLIVKCMSKTKISSVRAIIDLLDEEPLLDEKMMEFISWLAEYYMSGWGQAAYLALPKGIDNIETTQVSLTEKGDDGVLTERQRELYLIIGANPGNSTKYYRKKFGPGSFYHLLDKLVKSELITLQTERKGARVKHKLRKFVHIFPDYEQKSKEREDYQKYISRRPEIDRYMLERADQKILMSDFLKETGMANGTLRKMAGYNLCAIVDEKVEREPVIAYQESINIVRLTDEQESTLKRLREAHKEKKFSVQLLHGVTGSGKTQVYIEMLSEVLKAGRTAIILIPEIALTPQTVSRFRAAFSERIAVFHSRMSLGERYDAWTACSRGSVKIAIGPRSALFAPLKNIGLIVVDEEHDGSYKQSDSAPRYHARDAAVYRARQHEAMIILGSATPSLESYYNARKKKYNLLEILNRVDHVHMPHIFIVDMKKENRVKGTSAILFSKTLVEKISQRLHKGEQIILLQNRRGYSSFMQCKKCGFIPICPDCDLSLTYHSWDQKLQCHLCGHHQAGFFSCPVCGDKNIIYKGVGTQRIQNEIMELFPEVGILRMDQDTTRGKNKHDSILNAFGKGEASILLGTQMIAKGLDFPNVTLVGVISADVGLSIPDFRSPERVFQLLTQVAGRAGRGDKLGEVVVQTYVPQHYSVQFSQEHDFTGFYMEEMQHRNDYQYSPYFKMIQILFSSPQSSDVIKFSRQIAWELKRYGGNFGTIFGPSPALVSRVQNNFRWQLTIKLDKKGAEQGVRIKKIINNLVFKRKTAFPKNLQIIVDVDPVALF